MVHLQSFNWQFSETVTIIELQSMTKLEFIVKDSFKMLVLYKMLLFFRFITVPPMVTLASKVFVGREQTAFLFCEVEGNPTPIISWSPCDGKSVLCEEQYLNISKVQTARANYTCTATNALGVDSATTLLCKWTLLILVVLWSGILHLNAWALLLYLN